MDKIYAVDQIVENIVVLEEIHTKEKKEVELSSLPTVKEGTILTFNGTEYQIDESIEETRKNRIKEKLERLKNLKK